MAFARSASGPAGLSINTGAANMFGASSQPPAAGGLFGATSATQPSTQTNSLFGNNSNTTATATATASTATSQAAQNPSLFGTSTTNTNTNTQQQQQAGGGGMFGSSAAAAPKPGGLFGSSTTTSQPQQQSGGFFGQSTAASQPQPGQTGGLFGSATTTNNNASQPQQQAAGGLFGSTTTQQPAATGGGLFGGQQQKPATSLFGAASNNNPNNPTNTQPAMGSTGTGMFGQRPVQTGGGFFTSLNNTQANTQQNAAPTLGSTMGPQVVPGVRIDISNLRNTTRFNDLQEDLQKSIADIDQFVQNCISQKEQVDAFLPAHGEQLANIPGDVRFVSRKYAAVDSALGADLQAIKQMRDQVKTDAEEAKLSFNAVNNLLLPSQYHLEPGYLGASTRQSESGAGDKNGEGAQTTSTDLVSYFSKATDEMDEQIKKLQKTVREIETHLGGVEQNIHEQASRLQASSGALGGGNQDDRVMELYAVLREFEESIVQVATVVGGAREGVTELQMADLRGRGLNGYY